MTTKLTFDQYLANLEAELPEGTYTPDYDTRSHEGYTPEEIAAYEAEHIDPEEEEFYNRIAEGLTHKFSITELIGIGYEQLDGGAPTPDFDEAFRIYRERIHATGKELLWSDHDIELYASSFRTEFI